MLEGSFHQAKFEVQTGKRFISKEATMGTISDCGELILHNEPSVHRIMRGEWVISHVRSGWRIIGGARYIPSKKRGLEMLKLMSERSNGAWSKVGNDGVMSTETKSELRELVRGVRDA